MAREEPELLIQKYRYINLSLIATRISNRIIFITLILLQTTIWKEMLEARRAVLVISVLLCTFWLIEEVSAFFRLNRLEYVIAREIGGSREDAIIRSRYMGDIVSKQLNMFSVVEPFLWPAMASFIPAFIRP